MIVDVDVEEQGTGSFTFGASYGLDAGVAVMASFSERNFLGRGQFIKLEFTGGVDDRNYAFSFAEPRVLGRDLRLGVDMFYRETTWQDNLFDSVQGKAELNAAFPLSELGRFGAQVGIEGTEMDYYRTDTNGDGEITPADDATVVGGVLDAEIARGRQIGGYAGLNYSFSTARNGLDNPWNFYGEFAGKVGGLGADSQFIKGTALMRVSTTVLNEIQLSATLEGGAIHTVNGAGTRITDRFMMAPDKLLGFAGAGIGPRDLASPQEEALGGNFFGSARLETRFPIGLPEEYGITGGAFVHAGSVWGLDAPGAVDDDLRLRASAGAALYWETPIGPVKFSYAVPFKSEAYDKERRWG
ncbi:MAG: outer membrane protein assembly factor BamA, partial [Rhodobacterales bacterium]